MRPRFRLEPVIAGIALAMLTGCATTHPPPDSPPLPIRRVAEIPLSGGTGRFDYVAVDGQSGLVFIAHMGADQIVEVDERAHRVVRTIDNLPDVHGVIVVPAKHRIYATATGRDEMVAIDEDTGTVEFTSPTGHYGDGLAYDPVRNAVWTTNEEAGSETVIDADIGRVRATVPLGGAVGNVVYDPADDRMVVAVQGRGELAVIDVGTFAVIQRIPTPGCRGPHGQAIDAGARVMFVGCEGNAAVVSVDLTGGSVIDRRQVGADPDVLAYDPLRHELYVAAESGWVSVLHSQDGYLSSQGAEHLADGAHSLGLDPLTHHTFFPISEGSAGQPVLWEYAAA